MPRTLAFGDSFGDSFVEEKDMERGSSSQLQPPNARVLTLTGRGGASPPSSPKSISALEIAEHEPRDHAARSAAAVTVQAGIRRMGATIKAQAMRLNVSHCRTPKTPHPHP